MNKNEILDQLSEIKEDFTEEVIEKINKVIINNFTLAEIRQINWYRVFYPGEVEVLIKSGVLPKSALQ